MKATSTNIKRTLSCVLLVIHSAFIGPSTQAQTNDASHVDREAFIAALELKSIPVGLFQIFYGPAFVDDLDGLRVIFGEVGTILEEAETLANQLRSRSEAIIDEVNRLVGWTPEAEFRKEQTELLDLFLTKTFRSLVLQDPRIFVVSAEATKEYMKKGGHIPGAWQDPETGAFHAEIVRGWNSKTGFGHELAQLVIPVETMAEVKAFQSNLVQLISFEPGVAFHEVIEITLLKRLNPHFPDIRWFSDGFANALSELLLRQFVGDDAEAEFRDTFAVEPYMDLKSSLMLRQWLGSNYCVETNLEAERKRTQARYSFATLEVRRLIELHGHQIVKQTIEDVLQSVKDSNPNNINGLLLLKSLQRVTGDDLEGRFRDYQSFDSDEEGLEQFQSLLTDAQARMDHESAFLALLRLIELHVTVTGQLSLEPYRKAALHLIAMDREDEALGLFNQLMSNARGKSGENSILQAANDLIRIAWSLRHPEWASGLAEFVLTKDFDHVPALSVRMETLSQKEQFVEAKKVARRILSFDGSADPFYLSVAEFSMGLWYVQGQGGEVDMQKARDWFSRAAGRGHPKAAGNMGTLNLQGQGGPKDLAKAAEWYLKAAGEGDVESNRLLGVLFMNGMGVEKDEEKAMHYTRIAAQDGDVIAQSNLGKMYYGGIGVSRDLEQALQWYTLAAKGGDMDAQHALSFMYANGHGTEKNTEQAFLWGRKAAERGHAPSQLTVGKLLFAGLGAEKDVLKALQWIEKAAMQGLVEAQFLLGGIYFLGREVPESPGTAYKWMSLAAEGGNPEAEKALPEIASMLTPLEILSILREVSNLKSQMRGESPQGQ